MKHLILPTLLCLIFLTGCLDKRDVMQAQPPTINHVSREDLAAGLKQQAAEVVDTVAKKIVKLQAQFKNMMELNATLNATMSAKLESKIGDVKTDLNAAVASNNELRVMLKSQMDFNASLVAAIKVSAELEAKVSALGAAQVGIGNKLDQTTSELKQSFSAGHDVNSTNTQFTKEMLEALKSANQTTSDTSRQWAWIVSGIVSALSGLGLAYVHRQKVAADKRAFTAETRSMEHSRALDQHRDKLEKALCIVTGMDEAPKN
jgi:hypothetical protein